MITPQAHQDDFELAPATYASVVELDLRHLPAPEPMQRIIEALDTLHHGQCLLAYTPCRPQPLLDLLAVEGYRVVVTVAPAGDAQVQIFPRHDRTGR